jgi:hypothetical protein
MDKISSENFRNEFIVSSDSNFRFYGTKAIKHLFMNVFVALIQFFCKLRPKSDE